MTLNLDRKTWTVLALMVASAGGAALLTAHALATGAPSQTPLVFTGAVTDAAGQPYKTAQDVQVRFYDKADAATPKCTSPLAQAEAGSGRFSVTLPGECAQAVHDTPDLWSEVTVGAQKTVLPRVHVGAVPYALESDSAKVAATAVIATGVQCVGCVKVDAMGFDKDVDLKGKTLVAGKLDLGPEATDELTASHVKTLTGGGNADALHTHAGLGGSGGAPAIKFKGVTSVSFDGSEGLAAIHAQCAKDFGAARMCTSAMIEAMFPAPTPSTKAWVFADGIWAGSGSSSYAGVVAFGTFYLNQDINCFNSGGSGGPAGPFYAAGLQSKKGLLLVPSGAIIADNCFSKVPFPATCCGP